ncbi:hypothetical protein ACP4OV_015915 [Aristida adscensionis]
MAMAAASSTVCNQLVVVVLVVLVAASLSTPSIAQLQYGFYNSSCPQAEAIVRNVTEGIIIKDHTMGAALVRLLFHDCFVRGCDASILLNSTSSPERKAIALRGYDGVDQIKKAVEAACPGVVSCADILAFAARDSAVVTGGFPGFAMPSGRRDGTVSNFFDVLQHMPSPTFLLPDLIKSFAAKGLDAGDLVTLSGAHSFGQAHCSAFNGRLYPAVDPTMDAAFGAALQAVCPPPGSDGGGDPAVSNNRVTEPSTLSSQYYRNVLGGKVLFRSDQQLTNTTDMAARVSSSTDAGVWMGKFAAALVKMGSIQVLTGAAGQVRRVCYAVNS